VDWTKTKTKIKTADYKTLPKTHRTKVAWAQTDCVGWKDGPPVVTPLVTVSGVNVLTGTFSHTAT